MDKKELVPCFNKFRAICLKNAEDLLNASKTVLDTGIDHASFHLSLMALEEIGKLELEAIKVMSLAYPKEEPIRLNFDIDDHQRKIFFAFWGPSFGVKKQTQELIDSDRNIARNLHQSRLIYLYSDPSNPKHWSELMEKGEAEKLYKFVEMRLRLETAKSGLDATKIEEPDENLVWFLKVNEDEQRRKEIWGHKSQDKLLELGNMKEWIKWLKGIYQENESEMRDIAEKEMGRRQPSEKEKLDPKWRVRIEIISPSHSIRQKNLNEFNKQNRWFILSHRNTHTLGLEVILSKNVPLQGLWEYGWFMARMFLSALNIGTNGFFWWNIKRDPSKYYEEIRDMENNANVGVELNPRLEMNWKDRRLVLSPAELSLTSLVYYYLAECHLAKKENHINHYITGLSLLAKNDIHLRLEVNAFDEFFKAIKTAMIECGDWDEKIQFEEAYQKATVWRFPEITDEMRKIFPLGLKVEKEHQGAVDLTAVYAMKNYCEIYLQTLALRYLKDEKGEEYRIVVGKDVDESK